MRGETAFSGYRSISPNFNPLPSCEGRHFRRWRQRARSDISIHSPHARGDQPFGRIATRPFGISIHSPHARGDLVAIIVVLLSRYFNPLPSCEGRPGLCSSLTTMRNISIHSPHARGDAALDRQNGQAPISIHSPPARGDQVYVELFRERQDISIHSPHARGDNSRALSEQDGYYFNPLPSCEGRLDTFRAIWS